MDTEDGVLTNSINIGMLGYGWMARRHSFALKNISLNSHSETKINLTAICGRTSDPLKQTAKMFGYQKFYNDWRDVIKDHEVSVVDNVMPPNVHMDPTILAAEEGKAQICEKPLATTVSSAKEMVKAVSKAKTPNMVMFNYRYLPAIIRTKKSISDGDIGEIYQGRFLYIKQSHINTNNQSSWKEDPVISGGGALIDIGVHVADLARYLLGEISEVSSVTKKWINTGPDKKETDKRKTVNIEDAAISIIKFKNNQIGVLEASKVSTGLENTIRIELHGSLGAILWSSERPAELQLHKQKEGKNSWKTEYLPSPYDDSYGPLCIGHVIGLTDFIKQYEQEYPSYPSFNDGLEAMRIVEASYTSARENKWVKVDEC